MRTVFRWLITMVVVLHLLAPVAHAGWKSKVAGNERRATEYISLLKAGEEPGSIKRPFMRHINRYQAKQQQKRLNQAMDDAEALALAGRHDEIQKRLSVSPATRMSERARTLGGAHRVIEPVPS